MRPRNKSKQMKRDNKMQKDKPCSQSSLNILAGSQQGYHHSTPPTKGTRTKQTAQKATHGSAGRQQEQAQSKWSTEPESQGTREPIEARPHHRKQKEGDLRSKKL
jgi:hypothetical protein